MTVRKRYHVPLPSGGFYETFDHAKAMQVADDNGIDYELISWTEVG